MFHYKSLSPETEAEILKHPLYNYSQYAFPDDAAIRRNPNYDKASALRPTFVRDTDKIINCPFFSRYADKTQVFSFYKNDDISRRWLHVQYVSRIARSIGRALGLNIELIEAIALGHDIGHAPFAHAGERFLDEIFYTHAGRHFNHNIQSVRVLDKIFPYNITLQTLDGIACHNGELELSEYRPIPGKTFEEFDRQIEGCYENSENNLKLVPSTLEACVVRISDIIAYLGKDRQDAYKAHIADHSVFRKASIGIHNAEIISNLTINIIENSLGKPYIKMDAEHFEALKTTKEDNYKHIIQKDEIQNTLHLNVKPMMYDLFGSLKDDFINKRKNSPIYGHHINYVNLAPYDRETPYEMTEPNQLVVDFIASMTDDYMVDLYNYMFPDNKFKIEYQGYFNHANAEDPDE